MGAWIEIFILLFLLRPTSWSHPTMGAWIEIVSYILSGFLIHCRTPRWVRGLKLLLLQLSMIQSLSHPTMGAWIEIIKKVINKYGIEKSHPTMGAWIEIYYDVVLNCKDLCRTPRWVRGLKFSCIIYSSFPIAGRTPRWVRGLKYSMY